MTASAQLLLDALSKQVPAQTPPGACPFDHTAPTSYDAPLTSEPPLAYDVPLTSEPPLAHAAPLTSEPPLADIAPLTSEPTAPAMAGGIDGPGA
ncbi:MULTISPECIES: hypothetical protein [Streptomyces]|uniref:Uncharacterized protein n=1 Tax=Streptomyces sanyensis TaxID=568869 RepID=A0ABP8ZXP3_9ACTN